MSIGFDPVDEIEEFPRDVRQCSACGALVLDVYRHIHQDWHDRLDRALQAAGAP